MQLPEHQAALDSLPSTSQFAPATYASAFFPLPSNRALQIVSKYALQTLGATIVSGPAQHTTEVPDAGKKTISNLLRYMQILHEAENQQM